MCGIFGVIGSDKTYEEIKKGLERISYRGYDSSGIATLGKNLHIEKVKGHPENLPDIINDHELGIGHDRWSTHSPPTKENAHPYLSNDKKIALVHNGIIENYPEVKSFLEKKGFVFYSETDTEVLPNLIQHYIDETDSVEEAIVRMTGDIRGAYAIAFLHKDYPEQIFVARYGSPICIGKGNGKHYISSDINSLPSEITEIIALDNEKIGVIKKDSVKIKTFKGVNLQTEWEKIRSESKTYEMGDYFCYLEKEIFEQPFYLQNAINGRVIQSPPEIKLSGIQDYIEQIGSADEVIFVGCGTAFYAASVAAHAMENIGRVRARAVNAGELQYFNPIITKNTVLIAISQSGETADTIGCIDFYKSRGAKVIGVTNVVNSTISRMVDAGIYIRAGQELSVAATKSLTNQMFTLFMLAYIVGNKNGLSHPDYLSFISEVEKLPKKIDELNREQDFYKAVAKKYKDAKSMICIGRGLLETISYETALKVKEISYIHAEGYSAADLKHGPLALISPETPTISFIQSGLLGDKIISNIHEIKSREGPIIIVAASSQYEKIKEHATFVLEVEDLNNEYLNSILYLVVGQNLAYYLARELERPIDRPRNLAKSVTVE